MLTAALSGTLAAWWTAQDVASAAPLGCSAALQFAAGTCEGSDTSVVTATMAAPWLLGALGANSKEKSAASSRALAELQEQADVAKQRELEDLSPTPASLDGQGGPGRTRGRSLTA